MRVLIADENNSFRTFIPQIRDNEDGLNVVGEARNGEEAVSKTKELKPDLVLMHMERTRTDGLGAIGRLENSLPGTTVIMYSSVGGTECLDAAAQSGASKVSPKASEISQMFSSIRHRMQGRPTAGDTKVKGLSQ